MAEQVAEQAPLARRLAGALEPIAGQAQFSPECHANYERLGFPPSPGMRGTTHLPEMSSFWTSRTAVMGDAQPEVVAAAVAVFNPELAQAVLDENEQAIERIVSTTYADYDCQNYDLAVAWVPVGTRFRIHEYDGHESVVLFNEADYYIA